MFSSQNLHNGVRPPVGYRRAGMNQRHTRASLLSISNKGNRTRNQPGTCIIHGGTPRTFAAPANRSFSNTGWRKIGRASCRERVEVRVGGASDKRKKRK